VNVSREDLQLSLGAYNATLGVAGFEQLRFYCSHGDGNRFLVITQRPSTVVGLDKLYEAQTAAGSDFHVVTPEWQIVLSIRMRQIIEILASLGWIHPETNGPSMKFVEGTWLPVLVDLHKCRRRSNQSGEDFLKRYKADQLLQIAAFASGRESVDNYIHCFVQGKDYLLKRLQDFK
jgi:hypothetical protein